MQQISWKIFLALFFIGAVIAQQKTQRLKSFQDSKTATTTTASEQAANIESLNQVNDKRVTSTAMSNGASSTTAMPMPGSGTAIYRLKAASGDTCTLIRVDALLTFTYREIFGDETESDLYLPEDVTVSGMCSQNDNSFLLMRWKSYALNWYFAKTPGGDRWYMEKMEVSFNASEKIFKHFPQPTRVIRLSTPKDRTTMLFPTPVGQSYVCGDEKTVKLEGSKDVKVAVLLRDIKLQPFLFKDDNFGPEFVCSPGEKSYRDETAPLAVGSTLAVVVLLTVTGYGVYRYFKIKKVQYDTME